MASFENTDGDFTTRVLPLINHTAVFLYTFPDLVKPGPQNLLLSTLPFYHLVIYTASLVIWIVVLVYFWKFVYYEVNDPYATPYGSAPPYGRRIEDSTWDSNKILEKINYFADKITSWNVP